MQVTLETDTQASDMLDAAAPGVKAPQVEIVGHGSAESIVSDTAATTAAAADTLVGIARMCDLFGVTARTLRFYEAKGLIAPIREGQRRLYTKACRARLTLILRGKRFGFSLEEIGELLDLYDRDGSRLPQLSRTYAIALERLAQMERQRTELDVAIADLRAEIAWGADMLASLAPAAESNAPGLIAPESPTQTGE